MDNWFIVRDNDGFVMLNDTNLVLQEKGTGEVGYVENTEENRTIFSITQEEIRSESNCSDVIPVSTQTLNGTNRSDSSDSEVVETWSDAPTKLLIHLYQEAQPKLGKTVKLKTKKKMWEYIHRQMEAKGYKFNVTQVENKWKTLERNFKRKTENNRKTGRSRATCSYEKELSDCMLKKSSVIPEFLLSSSGAGKNREQIIKDLNLEPENETNATPQIIENPDDSSKNQVEAAAQTPSKKLLMKKNCHKATREGAISKELRELRLLREKHQEDLIAVQNKRLAAYEARTEAIVKKNEILEKFLAHMSTK